jgi:hypothetical protein
VSIPPSAAADLRLSRPWRRAWLTAVATWAIAVASYLLVNAMYWTVTRQNAPQLAQFFNVWNRWDTGHYLTIADTGYDPAKSNPAFFPLYPMLIRYVDPVLPGHGLAAALVVASVACIVALAFIQRLVEDLFETQTAARAVLYLMASPFAFYLVAAYNESLFVALCAGSLYFMHRSRWWSAGLMAGFASGTRYFGVILALPFVIEYLRQREWQWRRIRWDAAAILLVPSGLLAYMTYAAMRWGDPWIFAHLQEASWGHQLSPPWRGILDTIDQINRVSAASPLDGWAVLNVIDLVTVPVVCLLLLLCLVGPWRLGPPSWYLVAFGAAEFLGVLMSPMVTGLPPLHGLPRYALEMLPIFVVLARIGADRGFERAYLFPAIAMQTALLTAYFVNVFLS